MMKRILYIGFVFLLIVSNLNTQKARVACVGDDVTYGYELDSRDKEITLQFSRNYLAISIR